MKMNTWMAIIIFVFKKNSDQKPISDRSDRSNRVFWVFWSVFFWNKYNDGNLSIHFIQNLMLNSNLKPDIQKNIEIKRIKTKKLSERVCPSANTSYHISYHFFTINSK
jgi:hypothetical protein